MKKGQADIGDILRLIAFFFGLALFISGLIDSGNLGNVELLNVFSVGGTALLKIVFGAFFMLAGISPESVGMIIRVFIRA